jgi:hypothetical protein
LHQHAFHAAALHAIFLHAAAAAAALLRCVPTEVLAHSLAKLQEVVDSLHTDNWMFEVPRHTHH